MKSKLILSTKLGRNGKSYLENYFAQPPFKVLTLPAVDNELNAIQMSSSPGILAGDDLEIQLCLAPDTALTLKTQAFSRVQSMNEGESAQQNTLIQLAENSRLFYLPHPLVLHEKSAFYQSTKIDMMEKSQLIYGEVVASGRVMNQEQFKFQDFNSYLEISYQQKPILIDRVKWQPGKDALDVLGQMENFSHQGSLIFIHIGQLQAELKEKLINIQQHIQTYQQMLIGASLLSEHGIIVRAMAYRSDHIEQLFETISTQFF